MRVSSKFLTESTGEKIVKIGQYLTKISTKYDSLVFLGHPVEARSQIMQINRHSIMTALKIQDEMFFFCNSVVKIDYI